MIGFKEAFGVFLLKKCTYNVLITNHNPFSDIQDQIGIKKLGGPKIEKCVGACGEFGSRVLRMEKHKGALYSNFDFLQNNIFH